MTTILNTLKTALIRSHLLRAIADSDLSTFDPSLLSTEDKDDILESILPQYMGYLREEIKTLKSVQQGILVSFYTNSSSLCEVNEPFALYKCLIPLLKELPLVNFEGLFAEVRPSATLHPITATAIAVHYQHCVLEGNTFWESFSEFKQFFSDHRITEGSLFADAYKPFYEHNVSPELLWDFLREVDVKEDRSKATDYNLAAHYVILGSPWFHLAKAMDWGDFEEFFSYLTKLYPLCDLKGVWLGLYSEELKMWFDAAKDDLTNPTEGGIKAWCENNDCDYLSELIGVFKQASLWDEINNRDLG